MSIATHTRSMGDARYAVETHQLRKTYRKATGGLTVAVSGLDLRVPTGGVHGFLGPNGSGKTTTIRMLLGLIRADSGTMSIFGQPVPAQLPTVVGRVGAIVEQPKFYPYFSARENLIQLAGAIGAPRSKVDAVLEAVQLRDRARDKYRTFSLGMKQRLAIAATLLKDPDLLIFDEPTNGLDPAGIREIRETMRSLASQGKTVLVSSHILAEVEHVADTVSIIGRGTLLAEGRVQDLIASSSVAEVRIGVPSTDLSPALAVLQAAGFAVRADGMQLSVSGAADASAVNRTLAQAGVYANHLSSQSAGLEQIFLELTAGEQPGGQVPPPPRPPEPGIQVRPHSGLPTLDGFPTNNGEVR